MLRVVTCLTTQHDFRLVLLAALICAVSVFTSFYVYSHATDTRSAGQNPIYRRHVWPALAGLITGSGIWATHFVAELAYRGGFPIAYDPVLTMLSLAIVIALTMLGYCLAAGDGLEKAAAGGAIVGAGIGAMHFTGMQALIVPGTLQWDPGLVTASLIIGVALASAAMVAQRRLPQRTAFWAAPGLLTLAICALHFTAMAAVSVVPDPTVVIPLSVMGNAGMAIAVAGAATVIIIAAVAALIQAQAQLRVEMELNARLAQQDELLKQREQELKRQDARFETAVDNMSQGLCLFDANQRVVIANHRYADIYGLTREQVKPGTTLRQILEARAAKGLYNNDSTKRWVETGIGKFTQEASDILHLSDGRFISVVRRPTGDGGLVTTHEDITDRQEMRVQVEQQNLLLKAQEEKLRAQMHLDVALNHMAQGLCMFDAEKRLVVHNDRYARLYQLPPELLKVGTPHDAIIAHRVLHGILKGERSEGAAVQKISALRQLPADASSNRVDELTDGRWISVTRQPMAGGGWVALHEDISDRLATERRLEQTKGNLDQYPFHWRWASADFRVELG